MWSCIHGVRMATLVVYTKTLGWTATVVVFPYCPSMDAHHWHTIFSFVCQKVIQ